MKIVMILLALSLTACLKTTYTDKKEYSIQSDTNIAERLALAEEIGESASTRFGKRAESIMASDSKSSFNVSWGKADANKVYVRCVSQTTDRTEAVKSLLNDCYNYVSEEFKARDPG